MRSGMNSFFDYGEASENISSRLASNDDRAADLKSIIVTTRTKTALQTN
jgi:hypothetical protein